MKASELALLDRRVAAAIGVMRESLAGQVSVSTLSKHVNLSPTRLRQLFKVETGCSPMRYLRDLRMQRAERLLRDTFLSIKEITLLIGVRDVSHFVRDFKKVVGLTPREFREKSRASK
jgi:transcriptional regulator GlxA family with amidase domain